MILRQRLTGNITDVTSYRYWLGLDENQGRRVSYPSRKRVREAFAIVSFLLFQSILSGSDKTICVGE
jgi:hypothetical protein